MTRHIRKSTAQQIVETVKDICNHDINFIDTHGIIFASTDLSRVGDYHEIGHQVILQGETIEVETDDGFLGTHKGVNIPIIHHGETVAVTGISGEPEEVRKYAALARKITLLILKEHEMDIRSQNEQTERNYVIRTLISGEKYNRAYMEDYLASLQVHLKTDCRTVIVQFNSRYNAPDHSLIESEIRKIFRQTGSALFTFNFPSEYILLVESAKWERWEESFFRLAENNKEILKIGVGLSRPLNRQKRSWESAILALKSVSTERNIAVFDQMDLEILLGGIQNNISREYLSKTISQLDEKDCILLKEYFDNSLSLKRTSEVLYIHKNTLQYQLDRISRVSGYNPRIFKEAVVLYLGLKLKQFAT